MKIILGLLLIIIGIIVGLYVGVWLCLIGGIVQIITEVRAEHLNATNVGIGVARVLFASFCGWASALLCFIPGGALIGSSK